MIERISPAELDELVERIERESTEVGARVAARIRSSALIRLGEDDPCVSSAVVAGTTAAMRGIGHMTGALIQARTNGWVRTLDEAAAWAMTSLHHNGTTAAELTGQTEVALAPHCTRCADLVHDAVRTQYATGCFAVIHALAQVGVIEGGGQPVGVEQLHQLGHTCENDLQVAIKGVFSGDDGHQH
ncbi:hypothetical protein SEA_LITTLEMUNCHKIN_64 [Gordonia phage LittleMunchkin]|nr:hypothetical protein SEA_LITTLEMUNCHKIN_64 [Gordonia phage LittleMunchkin]